MRMLPLFLAILPLFASITEELLEDMEECGIEVELKCPSFEGGVLTTDQGGIISSKSMRIQAEKISYVKTAEEHTVEAEGKLIVSYGIYVLVGSRLEYDFFTGEGVIYDGKSGIEPWFFGGKKILLHQDQEIEIIEGFLTTSEYCKPDWEIAAERARIFCNHTILAEHVGFYILGWQMMGLPRFTANLDSIFDSPIRYRVRWGGKQGLRLGTIYEVFDWNHLKTFARFDYRIERGPGGGIETYYLSPYKNHWFHTVNYVANDNTIDNPEQRTRYRLEGLYHNEWDCGRTSLDLSYDYLSDLNMPTDYEDDGLNLETAQKTQLNIRRQQGELAIANLYTRVRINDFQTVKQELPSIEALFHPVSIGKSGLVSENSFNLGYYDFKYDDDEPEVPDYHASRIEMRSRLYRPFAFGGLTLTPEGEAIAILYGTGPRTETEWLALGYFGADVRATLFKQYGSYKHVLEPYSRYRLLTVPTISPNKHFIFDINDGWWRESLLRFGLKQLLFAKFYDRYITPYLTLDLYSYAFFETPTMASALPRGYLDLNWFATSRIKNSLLAIWDFERQAVNTFNIRSEVTVNEDIAFSLEYRGRSSFAWRKADPENFILDSFRSEQALRNSLVSDQRETFLGEMFYRVTPRFSTHLQIRHGFDRLNEPNYTEYEVDLIWLLRSNWQMRMSFQRSEDEFRLTLYFNLLGKRPSLAYDPIGTMGHGIIEMR